MGQGSVAATATEQQGHPCSPPLSPVQSRLQGQACGGTWGTNCSSMARCWFPDGAPGHVPVCPPSLGTGSMAVLTLRDPFSWVSTPGLLCQPSPHGLGELQATDLPLSHCWGGDLGARGRALYPDPITWLGSPQLLTTVLWVCAPETKDSVGQGKV